MVKIAILLLKNIVSSQSCHSDSLCDLCEIPSRHPRARPESAEGDGAVHQPYHQTL